MPTAQLSAAHKWKSKGNTGGGLTQVALSTVSTILGQDGSNLQVIKFLVSIKCQLKRQQQSSGSGSHEVVYPFGN